MSIIRSDQQVALHDLLLAVQDNAAQYHDAAEFLDVSAVAAVLHGLGEQRQEMAQRLSEALRALGDQPSAADPERVGLEKLAHRLDAAVSGDHVVPILEQRLAAEQHLSELIDAARNAGLEANCATLVEELAAQSETVTERLQTLLRQQAGPQNDAP